MELFDKIQSDFNKKLFDVSLRKLYVEEQSTFDLGNKYQEICDILRDLVPFVQFKKREKHPWMSVTYSNAAG